MKLTPADARRIHNHLQKLSTGAAAMVPLYCGGEKCPFKERCPLYSIGKHPLGKQCLLENQLLKEWIMRYFHEYDVDPNNFTEVGYINELAEIEILLMRINMNLSKPENSELVVDKVVGILNDGETPLIQKDLSPFIELKERLQARRSRIIKLMVGDRQEKYKELAATKMRSEDDPSSNAAKLRGQMDRILAQAKDLDRKIKEAEGNIVDAEIVEAEEDVLTPEDLINSEE